MLVLCYLLKCIFSKQIIIKIYELYTITNYFDVNFKNILRVYKVL